MQEANSPGVEANRLLPAQKINMSGHNKWSKIKHKKGAADAARSKLFSMLSREITIQSKQAGGDENSPGLRTAIDKARKANMPKDNIERAVKKGVGGGSENYERVVYEGYGPGGVAMMITGITDNTNRTSNEIKHIFSKAGYALGTPGSASWAFSKKESEDGMDWVPNSPMDISENDKESLSKLIENLEENDDIENVYTNANY